MKQSKWITWSCWLPLLVGLTGCYYPAYPASPYGYAPAPQSNEVYPYGNMPAQPYAPAPQGHYPAPAYYGPAPYPSVGPVIVEGGFGVGGGGYRHWR